MEPAPREPRQSSQFAFDDQLPQAYDDLRALAQQVLHRWRGIQAVRPTSLVHETYVRLAATRNGVFHDRGHFLALSARAMRCILVDDTRRRTSLKRDGPETASDVFETRAPESPHASELLALDEALAELERRDARKARVVELRFFGGLSVEETAEALGASTATIKRDWRVAKAWLYRALGDRRPGGARA